MTSQSNAVYTERLRPGVLKTVEQVPIPKGLIRYHEPATALSRIINLLIATEKNDDRGEALDAYMAKIGSAVRDIVAVFRYQFAKRPPAADDISTIR